MSVPSQKTAPDAREPALAWYFSVDIGGRTIERFTACDGLSAEYEVEEYREGGNVGYVHRLPMRLKFTNVKLTRAVDMDSGEIASWFASVRTELLRQSATITAYDGNKKPVATWTLAGAWPVKYTGPQLNSAGATAATETLELAHNGFLTGL